MPLFKTYVFDSQEDSFFQADVKIFNGFFYNFEIADILIILSNTFVECSFQSR